MEPEDEAWAFANSILFAKYSGAPLRKDYEVISSTSYKVMGNLISTLMNINDGKNPLNLHELRFTHYSEGILEISPGDMIRVYYYPNDNQTRNSLLGIHDISALETISYDRKTSFEYFKEISGFIH